MQKTLIKKIVVFVLIIFLIEINVVSSTINDNMENIQYTSIKSNNYSDESSIWNTTVYSYCESGPMGKGFYAFEPNGTTRYGEWNGDDFFSGGTWTNDGRFLCCLHENGTLYEIDTKTLVAQAIGNGGVSLNGIAYNPVSEKLYGAANFDLYEIDLETGEQIYIGGYGSPMYMIEIEFDIDGVLYGWDIGTDCLWIINTSNGNASLVGSLGISINYAGGGSFDYRTDILYLTAYNSGLQLYECDEDTGQCSLIGNMGYCLDAFAISYDLNTTGPVTNIYFDPPNPDGFNNYYISNVTVTLNATGDFEVNTTYYRINSGNWRIYENPFVLSEDGNEILIEFYSVDDHGNIEEVKSSEINIDKTTPQMDLLWEVYEEDGIFWIGITADAFDDCSGMNKVEFFINDKLKETVEGPGPLYYWSIPFILSNYSVNGFICNKRIFEENISFFVIIAWTDKDYSFCPWEDEIKAIAYDNAGNFLEYVMPPSWPPPNSPIILRHFIFQNDYTGYIGRFFINAKFENGPLKDILYNYIFKENRFKHVIN